MSPQIRCMQYYTLHGCARSVLYDSELDPRPIRWCLTYQVSPLFTDSPANGCAGDVPPAPLNCPDTLLPVLTPVGTGLDLLDPAGLPDPLPRPGIRILPTGVDAPDPDPVSGDIAAGGCRIHGILRCIQPIHVCAYAARSRSSLRRSNCAR